MVKKIIVLVLAAALCLVLFVSGAGKSVSIGDKGMQNEENSVGQADGRSVLKTGLGIAGELRESRDAQETADGSAWYQVAMVALTLDEEGVLQACRLDGAVTEITFDSQGKLTADAETEIPSLWEQEAWRAQANALETWMTGKTLAEVSSGAPDGEVLPEGLNWETVLSAARAAADSAMPLGANPGDALKLAATLSTTSSTDAKADGEGKAQLDCDVIAMTMQGDVITSAVVDGLQAAVTFDQAGKITSDLSAPLQTKNQLGEAYGMKKYGGSAYEWNEQAAAFAAYIREKTPLEVKGIAVNDRTAPVETDLASTVSIAIGGFQKLVMKAAQER